jgi:ribokinase
MFDVIVLGDSCQDIFLVVNQDEAHVYCELNKQDCELCFHYADKIPVENKIEAVGGNAANAAVSLSRLGLATALYTHVGEDRAGKHVLSELEAEGVQRDYFMQDVGDETNYNTVITVSGERTILVYHRTRHYVLPKLAPAKWIYLTSMKDGFDSIIPTLLEYCSEHNVKLCYQPGTYQLRQKGDIITQLLHHTDLFFVNKEEAARYQDLPNTTPIPELLQGLHGLGIKIAVITDGQNGAYASDGTATYFLSTLPGIERKETTGAGDAFASATTAALSQGKSLPEALRWGLMQASSVIQFVGAEAGLLRTNQIQEYLQRYPEPQAVPYHP